MKEYAKDVLRDGIKFIITVVWVGIFFQASEKIYSLVTGKPKEPVKAVCIDFVQETKPVEAVKP